MTYPSFMQWSQQIKLDIEKFDGTPSRFLTFWQQFEAIHSDPSIPTLKKLLLLREYTTGPVKRTLDLYTPIAQNYDCMVKLLHEEYGSNQKAIIDLFAVMNRLPTRAQPGNTLETMGELQSILNQLEAHGENIDHCAYYSIFMDRLPKEVFTRISYMGGIPDTMSELKKKAYDAYKNIRIEKQHDARLVGSNYVNECSSSESASRSSYDRCVFCNKHPSKYECRTVVDVSERKDILFKSGKCLYCFSDDHQSNHCYDRPTCSKCGNLHNSFLCNTGTTKRPESPKKDMSTTVASAVQPKSNDSHSDNNILLITANTKAQNPATKASRKAVIFIDTGSEASFIHRKLAKQLRLKSECQVTLNIKPFEAAEMPLGTTQTTVRLRLADGTWKPLKVYIVDNLIGKVKRADNDNKAVPSIREETPDILIGMDQLAEVSKLQMQLDDATGKPYFETSFGNVLAGPQNQSVCPAARPIKVNSSTVTRNDQAKLVSNSNFKMDNAVSPAFTNDITFDDNTTRQEAKPPVQSDENNTKDTESPTLPRLRQQGNHLITYEVMAMPLKESVTEKVVNSEEATTNELNVDSRSFTTESSHPDPASYLKHELPGKNTESATPTGVPPPKRQPDTAKEAKPSSSPSPRRREALLPKVPLSHPDAITDRPAKSDSRPSRSHETTLRLRFIRAHINRQLHVFYKIRKQLFRSKLKYQNPELKRPNKRHPARKPNLQLQHCSSLKHPVRQPKHPTVHRHVRDHPDNHAHLKMKSSLRRECRNAASIATNFVLRSHICTMP
uniref:DUF1758 domain-containing protein n=1 Tax=Panagrellus redivivus TaxID=6233 RepID=A0A7E4ZVZ8_PANRE